MKPISLATSKITQEIRDNVNKALDDNRIAQGEFNTLFESKVAKYMEVKHAIGVCNGSMADIISLAVLKSLRPDKTEVIVPALTFIAQTNAIIINGLKPVFVDVGEDYQINMNSVWNAITDKTLAVMVVHLLGRDCQAERLATVLNYGRPNIFIVEDCCEAYGGSVRDKKFGTFGDFGTFSFFPSHTITTGEGGMLITNDDNLADLARACRNHGRMPGVGILDMFHFPIFGFNGKMNNLSAAVGCAVVDTADKVIQTRKCNVALYNKLLQEDWYASSPHCYPVKYKTEKLRDETLLRLYENKIEARKLFSCLPVQERVYANLGYKQGDFPIAEKIGKTHLFVPVHQDLTKSQIQRIVKYL